MSKSIASLLAFAVTTSLALANGGEGDKKGNPYQGGSNWKPGQGLQLANGEDFSLRMWNQLQVGWEFAANDTAADTSSFGIPRARIAMMGHAINKDLTYRVMIDGVDDGTSNGGALKDGWAQWAFSKGEGTSLSLRVGQGLPHHGLESTGCAGGLFFVERSSTSRQFGQDRSRDTGAWVHGSHSENKIRWVAGAQNDDVANGSGFSTEEGSNPDNELTYVGSISFDPMGDTTGGKGNENFMQGDLEGAKDVKGTIGAGIQLGNNRAGGVDVESQQININTAWMLGNGITAQGEIFLRSDDTTGGTTEDTQGWYAQATYTLPKSGDSAIQWGFGARINMIDTDNTSSFFAAIPGLGGASGDVTEFSLVADAFYHGHAAKTQIEWTMQDVNPDAGASDTNHIIRVQFQLLF